MNRLTRLLSFTLGLAALGAQAEVVGRTQFAFADSQWTLLTTYETGLTFRGGSMPGATTVVHALPLLRSSRRSAGAHSTATRSPRTSGQ